MKIFNWVHRTISRHKDGIAQNTKKMGFIADESTDYEKAFTFENNQCFNVFDGWNRGILTIGTLGYDPLKVHESELQSDHDVSFYEQQPVAYHESNDQIITDSEEEEEEGEDEEVNPLVYAAYNAHGYEGLLEMKMEIKSEFEIAVLENTKKVRTTLAELFSADSHEEMHKKLEQVNEAGEKMKDKSISYKRRLSFAKKIVGDDARPIHKLHRLMRRVLKRKVHPDLGVHKHKHINSKVVNNKCCTGVSASLFPTQDANILMLDD